MKGTLHKTESGWQVWYHAKEDLFYGNTGVRILLLRPDEPLLVDKRWEGQEVEFEIVDYSQKCKECGEIVERGRSCMKGCFMKPGNFVATDKLQYAKIIDKATRPLTEDDAWPEYPTRADQLRKQTWQQIMEESGSWDALEILNYIIKNYNPPTKKQDNE